LRASTSAPRIRRYSIAQLLLFIPALVAVVAVTQALHRDRDPND